MLGRKKEQPEATLGPKELALGVRQQLVDLAAEIQINAATNPTEIRLHIEALAADVKDFHFGRGSAFDESEREDHRVINGRWVAFQRSVAELATSLLGHVESTIKTSAGTDEVTTPVLENLPVRLAHVGSVNRLVVQLDAVLSFAAKRASDRAERIAANVRALDQLEADEVGRALVTLWRIVDVESRSTIGPAGRKELSWKLLPQLERNMANRAPGLSMDLLRAAMVARNATK